MTPLSMHRKCMHLSDPREGAKDGECKFDHKHMECERRKSQTRRQIYENGGEGISSRQTDINYLL